MNIPGIRLIIPLLFGLLFLAVESSNAKDPEKAKPSPTPNPSERVNRPTFGSGLAKTTPTPEARRRKGTISMLERSANKVSPTPKPNSARLPTGHENVKTNYRTAASPTPKAK